MTTIDSTALASTRGEAVPLSLSTNPSTRMFWATSSIEPDDSICPPPATSRLPGVRASIRPSARETRTLPPLKTLICGASIRTRLWAKMSPLRSKGSGVEIRTEPVSMIVASPSTRGWPTLPSISSCFGPLRRMLPPSPVFSTPVEVR